MNMQTFNADSDSTFDPTVDKGLSCDIYEYFSSPNFLANLEVFDENRCRTHCGLRSSVVRIDEQAHCSFGMPLVISRKPLYTPETPPHRPNSYSGSIFYPNTSTCTSIIQQSPSSTSITKFFHENNATNHAHISMNREEKIDGSGLDFTLGNSPESWGSRKDDNIQAPEVLYLTDFTRGNDIALDEQIQNQTSFYELSYATESFEIVEPPWTFDEQVAISLLNSSMSQNRGNSDRALRRPVSRCKLVITTVTERLVRAARKYLSRALHW